MTPADKKTRLAAKTTGLDSGLVRVHIYSGRSRGYGNLASDSRRSASALAPHNFEVRLSVSISHIPSTCWAEMSL
eukprot:4134046-Pleurochrysis_carterae.AAC.1